VNSAIWLAASFYRGEVRTLYREWQIEHPGAPGPVSVSIEFSALPFVHYRFALRFAILTPAPPPFSAMN
jgi:hypothetical protein